MRNSGMLLAAVLTGLSVAVGDALAVDAVSGAPGRVEADGQKDQSAPATLVGDVLVRTDARGRLAVVIDEERAGVPADGVADRVFLLETERPLEEPIERRFLLASIVFRGRSLFVSAPATSFTIDLQIRSSNDRQRYVGEDGIVLHDGVALQNRRLDDALALDAVSTDAFVTTLGRSGGGASAAEECQAGGESASSCSKTCLFSAGVSKGGGCAITCAPGYYPCCNCSWSDGPSCACHFDFWGYFIGCLSPDVL